LKLKYAPANLEITAKGIYGSATHWKWSVPNDKLGAFHKLDGKFKLALDDGAKAPGASNLSKSWTFTKSKDKKFGKKGQKQTLKGFKIKHPALAWLGTTWCREDNGTNAAIRQDDSPVKDSPDNRGFLCDKIEDSPDKDSQFW